MTAIQLAAEWRALATFIEGDHYSDAATSGEARGLRECADKLEEWAATLAPRQSPEHAVMAAPDPVAYAMGERADVVAYLRGWSGSVGAFLDERAAEIEQGLHVGAST